MDRQEPPLSNTPKRIRRSLAGFFTGERIPYPSYDEALTYDALLSLRGWGRDEFATASPDFIAAARFAVFAERVAPILAAAQELAAMPASGMTPAQIKAKVAASAAIPNLHSALFPEDEPIG